MIERGCRHRLLGPIVILLLVVLLASVFLHVVVEGAEAAAQLGDLCVAIAAALGSLLLVRSLPRVYVRTSGVAERGPPRLALIPTIGPPARLAAPVAIPLRR
jgi:hypothetical protein